MITQRLSVMMQFLTAVEMRHHRVKLDRQQ